MFLILAVFALAASASAYVYDMSRHNRSVVVHRLFSSSSSEKPMCALRVTRYNDTRLSEQTRLPQGYRLPNSTSRPLPSRPNKTTPTTVQPQPAPAPRSLRH